MTKTEILFKQKKRLMQGFFVTFISIDSQSFRNWMHSKDGDRFCSTATRATLRIESLLTYYKINSILTSTEGIYDHARMSYIFSFFYPLFGCCCWCYVVRIDWVNDSGITHRVIYSEIHSLPTASDLACFYSLPTHGNYARYYYFILQVKIGKKKKNFLVEIVCRSAFTANSRWPVYVGR